MAISAELNNFNLAKSVVYRTNPVITMVISVILRGNQNQGVVIFLKCW
jgi:hypothetical protein